MKTAIAVFVKTPGLSPVKTRLAKSIGTAAAEAFFIKCIQTIEQTLDEVKKISKGEVVQYWAVGEIEGLTHNLWQNFRTIHTGDGSLGNRQHHVYSTLLKDHDYVIMLGADSPQITPNQLLNVINSLKHENDFIMGPALDGGYYLFAGHREIPKKIWTDVCYSVSNTGEKLIKELEHIGFVKRLNEMVDVDTVHELDRLVFELNASDLAYLKKLANWIENETSMGRSQTGQLVKPLQFENIQCG